MLIATVIMYGAGIRINFSHSYPPGIYLVSKAHVYERNDLVLFCPPNNAAIHTAKARDYIRSGRCDSSTVPMIKRIVGLAGERVEFTPTILINGVALTDSERLITDSQHRPLTQLPNFMIPENSFFAYSDHAPKTSFDSRYFGAVPMTNIIGHIAPLYIF